MKAAPPKWTAKISTALLERIKHAVLADRDATEVFNSFNLVQYGVSRRTFRRYALRWRRDAEQRKQSSPPSRSGPDRTLESALRAMQEALDAKRLKSYTLPSFVKALIDLRELNIKEESEKRAAELHEMKLRELRKAVDKQTEGGAKSLTRGDVYDLIDNVMRGGG